VAEVFHRAGDGPFMREQQSVDLESLQAELTEARERLSATQEILEVISQSRQNEQPVFEAILRNAINLCHAASARLHMMNEEGSKYWMVAAQGKKLGAFAYAEEHSTKSPLALATAMREARTIAIDDIRDDDLYLKRDPTRVKLVEQEGVLSFLAVPLVRDGQSIGCLGLHRTEVRPFTKDEIRLVETFATQAVIAIEYVRQFLEVRNRLERERASREILEVISVSRNNDAPVFQVILKKAVELCGATVAGLNLVSENGESLHGIATHGHTSQFWQAGDYAIPMEKDDVLLVQTVKEGRTIQVPNLAETPGYLDRSNAFRVSAVEEEGIRSWLGVPLMRGGIAIGCFGLTRTEVKPFTPDEVSLVETFAAQAVIAIENVRQFREVQERLERERASREILQVISKSREDETPVFQVILERAARLCGAIRARLMLVNEENTHLSIVATWGEPNPTMPKGMLIDLEQDIIPVRAVTEKQVLNVPDARESRGYKAGNPLSVKTTDGSNTRSVLAVPLTKDEGVVGCIAISDPKVGAFNDNDVSLVQTFATQAVIAIENVRQFRALQGKTEEVQALNATLKEKVEKQVGEIERMNRLKRFLPAAVADTVVSSGSEKILSSHRALLGVLFCDIRGFTAFCETAEPEETIEVLQAYHEEMGKLINAHGAGVDHRMGDGIMVLFNDPLPCEDPAGDAVRLAMAMRARMSDLCKAWKRMGYRLGFGVGISLGYATVGMVGFEGRFDYTASGTAINLASRLCDEAEDGEILLSPRAAIAVEDAFQVETCGEVNLKGLREPLEVFRLIGTETT
jgi:GAF domain-containing protein